MESIHDSGDLIPGTLEMLILRALLRGSMHGYGVAEWIHQTSQNVLKVEEGARYPGGKELLAATFTRRGGVSRSFTEPGM